MSNTALRNSNRIIDRYALVVIGREDRGSQGYSAYKLHRFYAKSAHQLLRSFEMTQMRR